jgi:dTDP-glucose 4,6-dehydratase
VKAATAPDVVGATINLGTGRDVSIQELSEIVLSLVGRRLEVTTAADRLRPRDSEVDRLCSDPSLAARLLDWRARVSLEEGLAQTLTWIREHLGHYRDIGQYTV